MSDPAASERSQTERIAARPSVAPPADSVRLDLPDVPGTHRIDVPHAAPLRTAELPPANEPSESREATPRGGSGREMDVLLQASRLAEQLREQFLELDRRERSLNERLADLEQEQRNVRLWSQQTRADLDEREQAVVARETDAETRMQTVAALSARLEDVERELIDEREALEAERTRLRERVQQELEGDRADLARARESVEFERLRLAESIEEHRRQHAAARDELSARLLAERKRLEAEFESKLQAARDDLAARERELDVEREQLAALRDRQSTEHAEALANVERELATERDELRPRLEAVIQQEAAQLRETLDREWTEFDQQRVAWVADRDWERESLERERREHAAIVERFESELAVSRAELEAELAVRRDEHAAELAALRAESAAETEEQRRRLKQEQALYENRLRFQQEHLAKTRDELEQAHADYRRLHQQDRLRQAQSEAILRLRSRQLDHYRILLEEREHSVEREHQLLHRARRSIHGEVEQERVRLQTERDAWQEQREAQRAELRRQQHAQTVHSDNLEARRQRLDQLRADLEETHRSTLELRMAVEETWVQLAQDAGSDAARERVEEARAALSEHYRSLREALTQQRVEIEESQQHFQRQKDEFRDERQTLSEWVAERDEELRLREERLRRECEVLETRESAWQAARERWTQEKIRAEEVIRDLLRQLTEFNSPGGLPYRRRDADDPSREASTDPRD